MFFVIPSIFCLHACSPLRQAPREILETPASADTRAGRRAGPLQRNLLESRL